MCRPVLRRARVGEHRKSILVREVVQRLSQQKLQQYQEDLRKKAKTDYKFGAQ